MIKPRHLHNATSVEIDAIDTGIALTFRTDGEVDLTVLLPRALSYQLRDQLAPQSGEQADPDQPK